MEAKLEYPSLLFVMLTWNILLECIIVFLTVKISFKMDVMICEIFI